MCLRVPVGVYACIYVNIYFSIKFEIKRLYRYVLIITLIIFIFIIIILRPYPSFMCLCFIFCERKLYLREGKMRSKHNRDVTPTIGQAKWVSLVVIQVTCQYLSNLVGIPQQVVTYRELKNNVSKKNMINRNKITWRAELQLCMSVFHSPCNMSRLFLRGSQSLSCVGVSRRAFLLVFIYFSLFFFYFFISV